MSEIDRILFVLAEKVLFRLHVGSFPRKKKTQKTQLSENVIPQNLSKTKCNSLTPPPPVPEFEKKHSSGV